MKTTGFVYDPVFLDHDQMGHPECADRLRSIKQYLQKNYLLDHTEQITARRATEQEIFLGHTQKHLETARIVGTQNYASFDGDTYSNQHTFEAASKAVGGCIDLTKAVLDGSLSNGFALVRPPGHHATPTTAMGFCVFGTVALAAKYAIEHCGKKKVAIIDFDVHHGNGTQDITIDDPNILFVSSHQSPLYPGTGNLHEIGSGKAHGTTVNIPFPAYSGDSELLTLYEEVALPVVERFEPELILVSAGFDAHWKDPLAGTNLTNTGFHEISKRIQYCADTLCNGNLVCTLEGGYNVEVLGEATANLFGLLKGNEEFHDTEGKPISEGVSVQNLVRELRAIHEL